MESETFTLEEFLNEFELLALDSGYRLMMFRQPIGCGIFFGFFDPETNKCVYNTVVYLQRRNTIKEVLNQLRNMLGEENDGK